VRRAQITEFSPNAPPRGASVCQALISTPGTIDPGGWKRVINAGTVRAKLPSATNPEPPSHSRTQAEMIAPRVRRRVSRRLIPYLMFIYLLAYLDRANLGVAKLQMQKDLNFTDTVIGFGAGVFFFGFLLLDIPGSLIVERWSARKWIARIMVSWGIVAMLMGFIGTPLFGSFSTVGQFYSLRLLLGTAEAGFFPGVIVYLSHWYRIEDRARAMAFFIVTQPIAIATGIPISRWILDNVAWHAWSGWRWVFILEGSPPILFGIITLLYLVDRPREAKWLPDDEKRWLIEELRKEESRRIAARRVHVLDAFRHPQTFLLFAASFLIITGNQALIFFLPSMTESMKSMSVTFRTLGAALPYACSAAGILLNGIWAQRTGALRWHTAVPMLATGVSLGLAILAGDRSWLVMGLFCLAGFTSQAYLPAFWAMPSALLGKSAAATAVGLISLSNLGGFVGPYIFGYLKTATGHYEVGLSFLAGCMLLAGMLASMIRIPNDPKTEPAR
jgi:MFS transporter, ACS family, tartrate transporter